MQIVFCTYCEEWVKKDDLQKHLDSHAKNYSEDHRVAKSVDEYEERMKRIGYYMEKDDSDEA